MRTIVFQVNQQRIKNVDSVVHIYGGTNNYLNLKFEFDENWKDCIKVITFGKSKDLAVLKLTDDSCLVPEKAFDKDRLSFYLIGGRKDGYRIRSERFEVRLGG